MPQHQNAGLGKLMLSSFIELRKPLYLTAYTRNPSMLMSLAAQAESGQSYPLTIREDLLDIAMGMKNAEIDENGVCYHVGRYGDEGLYGGFDPAERLFGGQNMTFQQRFSGLESRANALVVVAKVKGVQS